jgi:PAS domain S-box-containing protein
MDDNDNQMDSSDPAPPNTDLRLIVETAALGIYAVDRDGTTTLCNAAFLKMLGFEREDDAIGRKLHDIIHHSPPDGSHYPTEECPIYRAARDGTPAHVTTELFYRLDGTSFPVEYWVRPILRDGVPQGAVCNFMSITVRRQREAELRRLNETLEQRIKDGTERLLARETLIRTFYEHSSECHAVLVETEDGQFRYEEINPATLSLYNKSRDQVIGYTATEIFGAERAAEVNMHLATCLREGKPHRYVRVQGGGTIEAIATPVPDERGASRRLVVSARDVTEYRLLEQQLRQAQKMEAVGQLTGGLAHDFNNLLTVVLGGLELIGRQIPHLQPPAAVARIARARDMALQGVERATALTSRLLAFSRRQTLSPQPIEPNKLVGGLSDLLRRSIGESISLETVLAAGLWPTFADPNQLESALLNMALNARDAMPDGGKLTIETANSYLDSAYVALLSEPVQPGQYVMIAVADTGIGMDPETRDQAFEPFFTTKEVGKGTGLGLSQVYGFVRQSGGHIKIYSEVDEGTTIKVYLPRHMGALEEAERDGSIPDTALASGHEVILVVEDDEALRVYTTDALRELGYTILVAPDAASALKILERSQVDLLFTDVVMPGGMNGRQLADEATRRNPVLKVLFTTGYTRNAIVHHGRLDPGVQLIGKPFSFADLGAKVRAVLDS